MIVIAFNGN